MTNLNDLINLIRCASNVTINVNITEGADPRCAESFTITPAPSVPDTMNEMMAMFAEPSTPATDFEEGDRVLVCHVRKNGDRVHTVGTVIKACGHDDKGWYTRVEGDNGKHYRAGLTYNEERLGTIIYELED